jgi:hypothetical protein
MVLQQHPYWCIGNISASHVQTTDSAVAQGSTPWYGITSSVEFFDFLIF